MMYDYARGNNAREDFLKGLIDIASLLRLDGLAVYIEDFALFVAPETFEGSISLKGWKRLDRYAKSKQLVLLPLLNLYGHAEQTLARPEFSSLRDDARGGTFNYGHPKTKPLIQRVLDVVTETFSSPWIHMGFDEVWGMGFARERRTGNPIDVPSVFAKNLTWAAAQIRQRGRRPMFWGDVPGVYYPEIIPDLPRDLIAVDWFYRREPRYPSMQRWADEGFEFWIAPSIGFAEHIWPDFEELAGSVAKVINAGKRAGAGGIIFTAWEQYNLPFAPRIPFLAWQAQLTEGLVKGEKSFQQGMSDWLRPTLGKSADVYAQTAMELGRLNRVLPMDLLLPGIDWADTRHRWRCLNPFAGRQIARARRILESTRQRAARFPDLKLTHERYALQVELLCGGWGDLKKRLVRAEEKNQSNWISERTAESYARQVKPMFEGLLRQIEGPESLRKPLAVQRCMAAFGAGGKKKIDPWQLPVGPTGQTTQFFVWYTKDALHLKFNCTQDQAPRGVEESVDFMLTRDDLIAVCLDVWGTRRGFLWFEGNPAGTVFCQVHDRDNVNSEWHPLAGRRKWGRAKTGKAGWSIEFRLPFRELGISPPGRGKEMGLAVERRYAWGEYPPSRWGGSGLVSRDRPGLLSRLVFC